MTAPALDPADALLLARLPEWAFQFTLVLCRAGAACMLIPGIGEAETPAMLRAGFALLLTLLLLPALAPMLPDAPASLWRGAGMVGAELLTGLFIGWLARLALLRFDLAGLAAGLELLRVFCQQKSSPMDR
jgi:flagellar biosynthetic protein FliR